MQGMNETSEITFHKAAGSTCKWTRLCDFKDLSAQSTLCSMGAWLDHNIPSPLKEATFRYQL
jgi:hypothetical protein